MNTDDGRNVKSIDVTDGINGGCYNMQKHWQKSSVCRVQNGPKLALTTGYKNSSKVVAQSVAHSTVWGANPHKHWVCRCTWP